MCLLIGLVTMLFGKRRRVWFRLRPAGDGGSTVSAGALARSEYSGFAEEFAALVSRAGGDPGPPARKIRTRTMMRPSPPRLSQLEEGKT